MCWRCNWLLTKKPNLSFSPYKIYVDMDGRVKIGGHWKNGDDAFGLINIGLRPGAATNALARRRAKKSKHGDEWRVQLGPTLPIMPVVDLRAISDEYLMVCKVPEPVLTRTIAWGHTQWSSTLTRLDMKVSTFCGIRYMNIKVRHTIGAFVSLGATAPIFSVGQVALVCMAKDFSPVIMASLISYVFVVEIMVLLLAESRKFGFFFGLWQVMMALDLVLKAIGVAYEFAAVVRVSSVSCSDQDYADDATTGAEVDQECLSKMSRKAWLNVGSLFAGTLSFFVAACLWWVARRLRLMIKNEDNTSQVLKSIEQPVKLHSPKPIALWLVGAAPFKRNESPSSSGAPPSRQKR
eukprot:Blabericola_migrator_1__3400@NODE_1_length_33786_cov_123_788665_g0_i0_p11_GENE_NODE_1_length_33786_cov_123_788665_g0_i0NODE_1_length_33786_cov_123_788665_g0_i0_p11_ORF_typecomplete_len350_score39_31FUSClike/PF12805_7/1_1e04FUSClike/PF12805_7/0_42_NODE_1_length_33786_cov_123_788665_g0_i075758624